MSIVLVHCLQYHMCTCSTNAAHCTAGAKRASLKKSAAVATFVPNEKCCSTNKNAQQHSMQGCLNQPHTEVADREGRLFTLSARVHLGKKQAETVWSHYSLLVKRQAHALRMLSKALHCTTSCLTTQIQGCQ
jgi:hypothetical protein